MKNEIFDLVCKEIGSHTTGKAPITSTLLLREDLGLSSMKMVMVLTATCQKLDISILDFADYELMRLKTVSDLTGLLYEKRTMRIKERLFDPLQILESDRISLRHIQKSDFELLKAIAYDPSIWKHFTVEILSDQELQRYIDDAVHDFEKKQRVTFLIFDKVRDCAVGMSSLGNISVVDRRIEIGWSWLGSDFQGVGINQEYKNLLLRFVFDELGFLRVEFKTDILNTKARKALTKIGGVEEGVLRSHTQMPHGRRRNTIYYSILQDEWALQNELA
jgi:RimJ/RimL family protein N-acetyltransferase